MLRCVRQSGAWTTAKGNVTAGSMIRLLTFTDLYPNAVQPRHGIFVEQRLRKLVEGGTVTAQVVAPIPWSVVARVPFFGPPSRLPGPQPRNVRHGTKVFYPRYPVIPGLSNWVNPISMALASLPVIKHLRKDGYEFDIIDAHFFYPAGIAAILLGLWLDKPVVVTARGSDINVHAQLHVQGALVRWAARRSAAVIAVSQALRDALTDIGAPAARITVVRNGVDFDTFKQGDRESLRARFGWCRPTLLTVGNLVPEKGQNFIIEALQNLPDTHLIIVGSGFEEGTLRKLAHKCGVHDRVTWISYLPQDQLAEYYVAADATVLASSREGMPNVLLESLACGTRVIASNVGGNPEIVSSEHAGILLRERSVDAVVEAVRKLAAAAATPAATRQFAQRFAWTAPIANLERLFEDVMSGAAQIHNSKRALPRDH